ncbi:hypothetical protein EDD36DRAFT_463352 [Exophiala viscosa]|uniref:Uncharacterized protein n=1 Tax=Exophiala viscosa TaxID=2486360 RepID=A0AAN6E061_9EURO|nr:hypothetical protein EDD36DRAFT_463352 [Exophiala viscosa]
MKWSSTRARLPLPKPPGRRWLSQKTEEVRRQALKTDEQAGVRSRLDRFVARTPRFLQPTVMQIRHAPVSHTVAFIILHELTAIVPLFGLTGAFHYGHWLPPYFAGGAWVSDGVERFGRYFRKKGWISESDEVEIEDKAREGKAGRPEGQKVSKWFNEGEGGTRLVIEFATAYAIVKALLPVRLFVSVWASPWFARAAVIPFRNITQSIFRPRKT